MAGHEVVGPLALAKTEDGKVLYLYQGSTVPDEVGADEVARLVETGLVAAVEEPAPKRSRSKDDASSGGSSPDET